MGPDDLDPGEEREHLTPSGGRVTGVVGLLVFASFVVGGIAEWDTFPHPITFFAIIGLVLTWAALLRPRISLTPTRIVLRNMFETVSIPLGAIDETALRQVFVIRAGDRKFISPALSRPYRDLARGGRRVPREGGFTAFGVVSGGLGSRGSVLEEGPSNGSQHTKDYVTYADQLISDRINSVRRELGISRYSPAAEELSREITRRPAPIELGAFAASVLAFVASFFF